MSKYTILIPFKESMFIVRPAQLAPPVCFSSQHCVNSERHNAAAINENSGFMFFIVGLWFPWFVLFLEACLSSAPLLDPHGVVLACVAVLRLGAFYSALTHLPVAANVYVGELSILLYNDGYGKQCKAYSNY